MDTNKSRICQWPACGGIRYENNIWCLAHCPYNQRPGDLLCYVVTCKKPVINRGTNTCAEHVYRAPETLEEKVLRLQKELEQAKVELNVEQRKDREEKVRQVAVALIEECPKGGKHTWIPSSYETQTDYRDYFPLRMTKAILRCPCGLVAKVEK